MSGGGRTTGSGARRAALGLAALVGAIALSACSGTGATTAARPGAVPGGTVATADPSPPVMPADTQAPPAGAPEPPADTQAPTSHPGGGGSPAATRHGYQSALAQWKAGATAISAQQGGYWLKAAADLKAGEGTDAGTTSGYPSAINELTELAALPDAQQTPAQNARYHADIGALDAFFATPGLYG